MSDVKFLEKLIGFWVFNVLKRTKTFTISAYLAFYAAQATGN